MLFSRALVQLFSFPISSFLRHLGLSRVMTWAWICHQLHSLSLSEALVLSLEDVGFSR